MKKTMMIMGAACALGFATCSDEDLSDNTKAAVEKVVEEAAEVVEPDKEPAVKVSPLYSMTHFQQRVIISAFIKWAECDQWVKASKASRLVDFTKARHEKCRRLFDDLNTFSEKAYGMSFTTAQWPKSEELDKVWANTKKGQYSCESQKGFDACVIVSETQISDLLTVESPY